MNKPCPRCGNPLLERDFGNTPLDGCSDCGGLWFDYQELNRLTHDPKIGLLDVEAAFNKGIREDNYLGDMNCPKCRVPLYAFSFPHTPHVALDACPQCKGIWLDDGELQKIAERIAQARPNYAPAIDPYERQREQMRNACRFLLSQPCPHCKMTNPASALACWQCGAALKALAVRHLCPRCDRPLQEASLASAAASVDACLACAGLWLEEGELPLFLRLSLDEIKRAQQGLLAGRRASPNTFRAARCPGCSYEMQPRDFGDSALQIDTCYYCKSVWLDAGELLKVYEAMQRGGAISLGAPPGDAWGQS